MSVQPDYSAAALMRDPATWEADRKARAKLEGAAPAMAAAIQRFLALCDARGAMDENACTRVVAEFRHALKEAGL